MQNAIHTIQQIWKSLNQSRRPNSIELLTKFVQKKDL